MLKHVFLSAPATLNIRDLIHLNLINHLLKSDLGGEKTEASVLLVLADSRQLFAVAFIILVSSGLRRERALVQFFTVTIINLDDLKGCPS